MRLVALCIIMLHFGIGPVTLRTNYHDVLVEVCISTLSCESGVKSLTCFVEFSCWYHYPYCHNWGLFGPPVKLCESEYSFNVHLDREEIRSITVITVEDEKRSIHRIIWHMKKVLPSEIFLNFVNWYLIMQVVDFKGDVANILIRPRSQMESQKEV